MQSLPSPHRIYWTQATTVLVLLGVATGLGFALDHQVSLTSQSMIYVLAVVLAAYTLPWLPSVVCALAAVTALNFFFVPPRWTFTVDSQEHLIGLFTMLLVALVISHLASALRRETELARANAQRAWQLQQLATALAEAASPQAVLALGRNTLAQAFGGPSVLVEPGAVDDFADLRDGLHCCMRESAVLGPGTGRWPGLEALYLPLGDKSQMHGAACIQGVRANDEAGREHAQALCALLAQALARLRMAQSMHAAQQESQRQQLQSTFLAAISHDLRTPLAAVVGAASALQTQRDKLSDAEQQRLLASIVDEASYLSTVTENTLQLVRLSSTTLDIRPDWESVQEVVGAVLARVRQRDPLRRIQSRVPENLPLVRVDAVLLAQLLSNLLDNALKYSDGAIDLVAKTPDGGVELSVKDRGPGIADAEMATLFEPYARSDRAGPHGAGLGLALCRAIAQAHDAALNVRQRRGGGCSVTLILPAVAQPTAGELP
jgi:two-component system, OmpR family, sensor histidine kinase KdpD